MARAERAGRDGSAGARTAAAWRCWPGSDRAGHRQPGRQRAGPPDKAGCRAGAWNSNPAQFQAHCYTDIYPLYFGEQLWHGQVSLPRSPGGVPGHHRRRNAGRRLDCPADRCDPARRRVLRLTVAVLALCAMARVLATRLPGGARGAGRRCSSPCPRLILASFINWDMIAMAWPRWPWRRGPAAAACSPAS